eukprot:TRINITY_DN85918_c0_g1_i1.p1 TRINITY_DN85918_c0_g1~~TRINITY_DN85918_c0_g1_i1.p1  ORF type:complete len:606 (-),score=141.75 TRINITY_DN85918_c0_g1_i1:65-1882(-)
MAQSCFVLAPARSQQVMWLIVFSIAMLPAVSGVKARTMGAQAPAPAAPAVDVNYVSEMLDKLKAFEESQTAVTEDHFNLEIKRIQADIANFTASAGAPASAQKAANLALLEESLKQIEFEKTEAQAAELQVMQYYHTVRAALGSQGGAPSCDFLSCGRHAECIMKENGRAFCECASCFSGDGFICRPSACKPDTFYTAEPLIPEDIKKLVEAGKANLNHVYKVDAREISMAVVTAEQVVAVMRDAKQGNRGYLSVGKIQPRGISWGDWQGFSGDAPAYAPVVTGFQGNGRFLVSFRDAEKRAIGYLVGGMIDKSDASGLKAIIGMPHGIAREQEQKMAFVPLTNSRVVALYADHVIDKEGVKQSSGSAAVVKVLADGALSMLGKYKFAPNLKVQYLSATSLSPLSFVVAYRGLPVGDAEMRMSKELSIVWMEMSKDDLLVIDPHPLILEPDRADILERDVALISKDLIGYSYYSMGQKQTKLQLVGIEQGHVLRAIGQPQVVGHGSTTYVKSISLASGTMMPGSFTYFQPALQNSMAEICGVVAGGQGLANCKDLLWADRELQDVSGTRLPDGRLAFAYSDMSGGLGYRLLSAEEAAAQDTTLFS